MKALECSQHFPIITILDFFSDAQRQLNPQSVVELGRISSSSEILWLPSLPAKMKNIQSKMKALEW